MSFWQNSAMFLYLGFLEVHGIFLSSSHSSACLSLYSVIFLFLGVAFVFARGVYELDLFRLVVGINRLKMAKLDTAKKVRKAPFRSLQFFSEFFMDKP